jgi:general secretion pathway protein D
LQPASNALTIFIASPVGAPTPFPLAGLTGQPAPIAAPGTLVTEVVLLKYADVSEVAGALVQGSNVASNDTFTPVNTNFGTSSSFGGGFGGSLQSGGFQQQGAATFGGAFGQANGLAQKLNDNIAVDRRLNAVILTGTQDVVDGLKTIIAKIDIPLPSVILETEILELTETSAKEIGFDFAPSGNGLVVNGSSSPAGYTIRSLQTGQGEINFGANLYAEIDKGNGRVLAKPRILAQSGAPASILTGDELPIITNIVIGGASATVQQQVNYVNVGVNLQIQPRVTSDGFVTSHIFSEVSSVTQFVQGIPQISQRQAQTIATVRDGESFIIGGLLQDNELHSLAKLPFIGDIPLLGTFFRHVTTSHSTTNLYILVTPHVVQSGNAGLPQQFTPPPGSQRVDAPALPSPPPALGH